MAIEILIAALGSGVLSTLISSIFTYWQSKKTRQNDIVDGLKTVLYDRIKHNAHKYIARGAITFEDLEDLVAMHKVYHDKLDGNGFLNGLMDQVGRLPIVERYEEYE